LHGRGQTEVGGGTEPTYSYRRVCPQSLGRFRESAHMRLFIQQSRRRPDPDIK
jgi:hypothetical protein